MTGFFEIVSFIVLPLGWGLAVELAFELLRRRYGRRKAGRPERDAP